MTVDFSKNVRVLCIAESPDRPTTALIIGLKQSGIEIQVMCPRGAIDYAALQAEGIPLLDHYPKRTIEPATVSKIRRLIKKNQFDILHVFGNRAITNAIVASLGLPVRLVTYRGIVGNLSFLDPISWMRYLNPRIDRIVCVAESVRRFFLEMKPAFLRLPAERLVTIYKGHDLNLVPEETRGSGRVRHSSPSLHCRLRRQLSTTQGHRCPGGRSGLAAGRVGGPSAAGRPHAGKETGAQNRLESDEGADSLDGIPSGRAPTHGRLRRLRAPLLEARGTGTIGDRINGLRNSPDCYRLRRQSGAGGKRRQRDRRPSGRPSRHCGSPALDGPTSGGTASHGRSSKGENPHRFQRQGHDSADG